MSFFHKRDLLRQCQETKSVKCRGVYKTKNIVRLLLPHKRKEPSGQPNILVKFETNLKAYVESTIYLIEIYFSEIYFTV